MTKSYKGITITLDVYNELVNRKKEPSQSFSAVIDDLLEKTKPVITQANRFEVE